VVGETNDHLPIAIEPLQDTGCWRSWNIEDLGALPLRTGTSTALKDVEGAVWV